MAGEFSAAGDRIIERLKGGMYAAAHDIMAVSEVEVPKDTLTLYGSRFVDVPESNGVTVSVTLGYGRGVEVNPKTGRIAAEYAVPVHEIMEAHHEPPTKAKFLEDPVLAYSGELEGILAAYISRAQEPILPGGGMAGFLEQIRGAGV